MNPHQWSLAKKCNLKKSKCDDPKVPKQAEAKRDGVKNHKITISINFNTENFDTLKRYESTEVRSDALIPANLHREHCSSQVIWSNDSYRLQSINILLA